MSTRLISIPVNSPGRFGLNRQQSSQTLSLDWAIKAHNIVFDEQGNLASRKGTARTNTTTITDNVESIHEYVELDGDTLVICAADDTIYKRVTTSLTDITGTATTPTAAHWKFINFNGKCIGAQADHNLIVLDDVDDSFTDISTSGSQQPTTAVNEIMSALGRVWALDGSDLKYSDLLDETTWDGVYDLAQYWGRGGDIGVALAEFNGHIIVFGKENILVYAYSWAGGAENLTKVEAINGIGCIARDSVQYVGDDIWFLSSSGVRSLSRTIQEKSLPLSDISKNIRDYMMLKLPSETATIKSVYNEYEGVYLLSFPAVHEVYAFDTRIRLEDGAARATTFEVDWLSMCTALDQTLYIGTAGFLNTYSGYEDNVDTDGTGGEDYPFCYYSPWTDCSFIAPELANRLKILKKMSATAFSSSAQVLQFHWFTDFRTTTYRRDIVFDPVAQQSQYGIAQYGIDTYSSEVNLSKAQTPMGRTGQYFSFGIYANINATKFSIQNMNLQAKIGRSVV